MAARRNSNMKVHPGIVAKGSYLCTSMPIPEGTPLIGVTGDLFLEEGSADGKGTKEDEMCQTLQEAVRAEHPQWWALRLALRLLKETASSKDPTWQSYSRSLEALPAVPTLWSFEQAKELQYAPAQKTIFERLAALQDFHRDHVFAPAGETPPLGKHIDATSLAIAEAAVGSRAMEIAPGRRALIPLLDLVGPPEGPEGWEIQMGKKLSSASCVLEIEATGGPTGSGLAFLSAARDLQRGEVLTRTDSSMNADDLLFRHGLATSFSAGSGNSAVQRADDAMIYAGISKESVQPWQLAIIREALDPEPGSRPGSWVVSAKVRRAKKLMEAIDPKLIFCARVLGCKSKEDLVGAEWVTLSKDEAAGLSNLDGLTSMQRRAALGVLKIAVEAAIKSFETTPEKDQEMLRGTSDENLRSAVAYRLEKKRLLADVLKLLERADDKEVGKRVERNKLADLPAALGGKKKSLAGKGFQ
eukprot:TRINITY_DN81964_c0_g1_i1.p1 TRINITY_DN81964_c0_g1~~TRINITY_DN81964_c0_g1_i1.p1  ORF type:complete len:537 (+),score=110.84 TRINITY_DN81964_c0_g1_i1:201-1613(+)